MKSQKFNSELLTSVSARRFPLTIRITAEERRLLMIASRSSGGSKADVLRSALNPLFARLARRVNAG